METLQGEVAARPMRTFALGVVGLLAAFATIIGMFVLNRLPMHYHPVQKAPQLTRLLDDRFHIVIEAADPKFNAAATREFLASIGGQDIAELED